MPRNARHWTWWIYVRRFCFHRWLTTWGILFIVQMNVYTNLWLITPFIFFLLLLLFVWFRATCNRVTSISSSFICDRLGERSEIPEPWDGYWRQARRKKEKSCQKNSDGLCPRFDKRIQSTKLKSFLQLHDGWCRFYCESTFGNQINLTFSFDERIQSNDDNDDNKKKKKIQFW